MNTSTGQIYNIDWVTPEGERNRQLMQEAIDRGEKVVEVSPRVAKLMTEALDARRRHAKRRREIQRASRKRNRR